MKYIFAHIQMMNVVHNVKTVMQVECSILVYFAEKMIVVMVRIASIVIRIMEYKENLIQFILGR